MEEFCLNILLKKKSIYKKVDSTLRGNIGAELTVLLANTLINSIFFCAALPSEKRTVSNGICYVDGVPLEQTEFATDPRTPIYSSSVREILVRQTDLPVVEVPLTLLHSTNKLIEINQIIRCHEKCIVSFDTETEEDLSAIVALSRKFEQVILAGSSGLANYLARQLNNSVIIGKQNSYLPILFVLGSMSEKTNQQADYLTQRSIVERIEIDVESLLLAESNSSQKTQQISTALLAGKNVLIKTCSDMTARKNIERLCKNYDLDRTTLGEIICTRLSTLIVAALIKNQWQISALFLTGGDMAIGIAKELAVSRYRIVDEIETGVPVGYFAGSCISSIPIITKAGGFGSVDILKKVIDFIKN
ncbi:four-carbon acid sugar kinase family protein [Pasteurellaceae bacterium LIM206]|nr:four-carbon acid sugar kinase family protein [Pasteurellaceae bacterium LIM206]